MLLALLVTHLFMCFNWPCYYRLVYCNTSACLQEHLSSVTIIFAVTLFSALGTLDIMVERIVCNTFIYLSEHLSIPLFFFAALFFQSMSRSRFYDKL
jgi:putative effector of murein hydrolase